MLHARNHPQGDAVKKRRASLAAASVFLLTAAMVSLGLAQEAGKFTQLTGPTVVLDDRGLPRILSESDARLYRRIFELQEEGRWGGVRFLTGLVKDRRLMGHVLAQRYLHPTAYRSEFYELAAWLERYGDHPQAKRLHALALKRRPNGASAPQAPSLVRASLGGRAARETSSYRSGKGRTPTQSDRVLGIEAKVTSLAAKGKLKEAEATLRNDARRKALDQAEIDQLQARIARGWYFKQGYAKAYWLAAAAAARSGEMVPVTHWVAGLSAWRRQHWRLAAEHFGAVASSPRASSWLAAGGAFWAARASLNRDDPASANRWLSVAAAYPRTFYGLVARETLGMSGSLDFGRPTLFSLEIQGLVASSAGGRALALLQVGKSSLARDELLLIGDWRHSNLGEVVVALASKAELARFAFNLARRLSDLRGLARSGRSLLAALYPLPGWEPDGGFLLDRALIFAVMRQESAFDPRAVSRAGARGLMQLMPSTAGYIAKDPRFNDSRREALFDPGLNIRLGQDYLNYLMAKEGIGDDLFHLLAAYNAGPATLARWRKEVDAGGDPLVFIESLHYGETRAYIERVLANYWIYRKRLGQPTPSLTEVAQGDWPRYRQLERGPERQAWMPEP